MSKIIVGGLVTLVLASGCGREPVIPSTNQPVNPPTIVQPGEPGKDLDEKLRFSDVTLVKIDTKQTVEGEGKGVTIFYSYSEDGGVTWSDVRKLHSYPYDAHLLSNPVDISYVVKNGYTHFLWKVYSTDTVGVRIPEDVSGTQTLRIFYARANKKEITFNEISQAKLITSGDFMSPQAKGSIFRNLAISADRDLLKIQAIEVGYSGEAFTMPAEDIMSLGNITRREWISHNNGLTWNEGQPIINNVSGYTIHTYYRQGGAHDKGERAIMPNQEIFIHRYLGDGKLELVSKLRSDQDGFYSVHLELGQYFIHPYDFSPSQETLLQWEKMSTFQLMLLTVKEGESVKQNVGSGSGLR